MHLGRQILSTSLIILIAGIFSTAKAKSLYAITDHAASALRAYDIQNDQLRYQADGNVPNLGSGAVDVTIDSNLKLPNQ